MNSKVNWIIVVVVLFVGLLVIGFLTIKKPVYSYKMTAKEIADKYIKTSDAISPEQVAKSANSNEYELIDVRIPSEFTKGSLKGAVNIPFSDLLSDEYKKIFNSEKPKLIYAENETVALQAWLVLTQIGYNNLKYLKGGYYPVICILNSDSTFDIRKATDENLLYDFSKLNLKEDNTKKAVKKEEVIKTKKPVKLEVKDQPSGGC